MCCWEWIRVMHGPNVRNSSHGQNVVYSSHGPNVETHAGPNGVPSFNFVQVDQGDLGSPKPIGVDRVPRFTKPRARVYTRSDPCVGLPRLGDLHASDYSESSVSSSYVNTTQLGSSTGNDDSYIPVRSGTTSWYPDSGASHHACRDVSALRDVTPYSGCRDSGDITDGPHS
ncbi:hypothetical protein V6Z11_D12G105400 [Gossypium hirsutum]|uniref:Uncharacterized protein n=1 Tax=Gossypium hirsutum TaxID=3635 RepID=A0A1U8N7F6_GOSHI|nr:uncharacterized protein LOC107945509 [Gossypium hirsutum]